MKKFSKRAFLKSSLSASAVAFMLASIPKLGFASSNFFSDIVFTQITPPKLPYRKKALEPYISEETITYHFEKHHLGYFAKLQQLIKENKINESNLVNIILDNYGKNEAVFNNAAQVWNHNFYWNSMRKNGGGEIQENLLKDKIITNFGSFENFKEKFTENAMSQFGSGWVWLVVDKNQKLKISKTNNADFPQLYDELPLLCIDIWEHAYYLDYKNQRADYVRVYLENLVNWKFANFNLNEALKAFS